MPVHPVERKLAAILAADIAGYSRLMARDEVGTLAQLMTCRAIVDRLIAAHRGRIFNPAGDSAVAVRHLLKPRRANGGRKAHERHLPWHNHPSKSA